MAGAAAMRDDKADCCGIAGVVGAKGDAREFLIEGLTILKNRGYDSMGIATMSGKPSDGLVSTIKRRKSNSIMCIFEF
jgi:glucosamine--fructose-6-phosphate aminotransferase (isomerizing)